MSCRKCQQLTDAVAEQIAGHHIYCPDVAHLRQRYRQLRTAIVPNPIRRCDLTLDGSLNLSGVFTAQELKSLTSALEDN